MKITIELTEVQAKLLEKTEIGFNGIGTKTSIARTSLLYGLLCTAAGLKVRAPEIGHDPTLELLNERRLNSDKITGDWIF